MSLSRNRFRGRNRVPFSFGAVVLNRRDAEGTEEKEKLVTCSVLSVVNSALNQKYTRTIISN